jgi:hypothetical protein
MPPPGLYAAGEGQSGSALSKELLRRPPKDHPGALRKVLRDSSGNAIDVLCCLLWRKMHL